MDFPDFGRITFVVRGKCRPGVTGKLRYRDEKREKNND